MKTLFKITTVVLFAITLAGSALGQSASPKPDSLNTKRAQNVFVELGGPGLLFSANYDTRFNYSQNGLGGRVGLGYLASGGFSVTTIPVQLNYLLGKKGKYFEIGVGATYAKASNDDADDDFLDFNGSGTIGTMTFAYRYQPVNGGFNFRGGLNTLFNSSNFIPFYGISFGYTF